MGSESSLDPKNGMKLMGFALKDAGKTGPWHDTLTQEQMRNLNESYYKAGAIRGHQRSASEAVTFAGLTLQPGSYGRLKLPSGRTVTHPRTEALRSETSRDTSIGQPL